MPDRETVIKGLEFHKSRYCGNKTEDLCPYWSQEECGNALASDALALLKEQEDLKQKMWNALYAEEDKLEKKFIGTEEHDDWFTIYRPWLQRGFEIAIRVIAEQDRR